MATNSFVEINLREAHALADLTGIAHDLESARNFALRIREARGNHHEHVVADALHTAALIRYSRPFKKGVRRSLGNLEKGILSSLTKDQLQAHERLLLYRDKYFAHSVNAFEENQPVARYWVERVQDEGISSIGCQSTRLVGLSGNEIESIIDLTTFFLDHIGARIEQEKLKVLQIVRAMDINEVLKGRPRRPEQSLKSVYPSQAHVVAHGKTAKKLKHKD